MSYVVQNVSGIVIQLKDTIVSAQVRAAKMVNREMLQLYYFVGAVLSVESEKANWGDKVLKNISAKLQQELPGLRGFSAQNLKKMKLFYEAYPFSEFGSSLLGEDIEKSSSPIGSALLNQLEKPSSEIGSAVLNQLVEHFWNLGFTSHYLIVSKVDSSEERAFYVTQVSQNGWSTRILQNHLKNNLFGNRGSLPTNFEKTLAHTHVQAISQFRDEYLLDFMSLNDADDERLIEGKIVNNITQFILNLGKGFSFIGNQYRVVVGGSEFFIDLLFYNRPLQALVAVELKRGAFKPGYVGQLGFYLNALDRNVRLPHEKASIGIILCKEKNNVVVEYAINGLDKPVGVATFKTREEIPDEFRNVLPGMDDLAKLMDE